MKLIEASTINFLCALLPQHDTFKLDLAWLTSYVGIMSCDLCHTWYRSTSAPHACTISCLYLYQVSVLDSGFMLGDGGGCYTGAAPCCVLLLNIPTTPSTILSQPFLPKTMAHTCHPAHNTQHTAHPSLVQGPPTYTSNLHLTPTITSPTPVWEGLRLHRGVLCFAREHLERLYEGAKAIDMHLDLTPGGRASRTRGPHS